MVENVFRSVNIALVNGLRCSWIKLRLILTSFNRNKPFGFTQASPGPGYESLHSIRSILFILVSKKKNFELKFIKTAGQINRKITDWIVKKSLNL